MWQVVVPWASSLPLESKKPAFRHPGLTPDMDDAAFAAHQSGFR
jgi:hypothetical protein